MLLNLQFAFWSLLGVISPPPRQVSVMGGVGAGETETLSIFPRPSVSWLLSSKEETVAVRIPNRGSLPLAEIGSDVSQMHLMASEDGYDFFSVYAKCHEGSLSGLGLQVQYNLAVCRELSVFLGFKGPVGLHAFPHLFLKQSCVVRTITILILQMRN